MIFYIRFAKLKKYISTIMALILFGLGIYFINQAVLPTASFESLEIEEVLEEEIQRIFDERNRAIIDEDKEILNKLYDLNLSAGIYAYEHEVKKMEYIHHWEAKQLATLTDINSKVFLRSVKEKGDGYTVTLAVTTEYKYNYNGLEEDDNSSRIGTYHTLDLRLNNGNWMITKEWYTDPFADSLHIDKMNVEKINEIISSGKRKDLSDLSEKRKNAVAYADEHCGVARPPLYSFKYNPDYRNYNHLGGDCTNFASQVLHEGGGFSKTSVWNYVREGTRAWVNAHGFNDYMLYSGRGSLIVKGTYEEVLKHSYKLLPGDYIAYEKKGRVAHISVVSGEDSKGYILVNSHNTDRYRVPWDLGWNDTGIRFVLVRVNY